MSNNAFEKDYSDDSFWDKVKTYAKSAGETALEPALKMYYAATDADKIGRASCRERVSSPV